MPRGGNPEGTPLIVLGKDGVYYILSQVDSFRPSRQTRWSGTRPSTAPQYGDDWLIGTAGCRHDGYRWCGAYVYNRILELPLLASLLSLGEPR